MKKTFYCLIIVNILLSLYSCESMSNTYTSIEDEAVNVEVDNANRETEVQKNDLDFASVKEMINNKRFESVLSDASIDDYIFETDDEDFTEDEVNMLLAYKSFEYKTITKDSALEDIDYLFRIFKLQYGGYTLFGGDETFNEARFRIEDEVSKLDRISTDVFEKLLAKELSFINDGHMGIGRKGINESFNMKYYANEKMPFHKDEKGYYNVENEAIKYLHSVENDMNVEEYMKLSLDEEGKFVYYLGSLFSENKGTEKVNLEFIDNDELISDEVALIRSSKKFNRDMVTYEEERIDGIPVISIRRFHELDGEIELKKFVESGIKYKDEDIIIVDIRGNLGGTSLWAELWYENYTGHFPESGTNRITRFSNIYRKLISDYKSNMQVDMFDKYEMPKLNLIIQEYLSAYEKGLSSKGVAYQKDENAYERVKNDRLVFLLVDKAVASAGEGFVIGLKTIDNVIVVGTNTMGCMDISNNAHLFLPNSSIGVFLGVGLEMQYNTPHFYDGVGIEPDIWISNDKIIDKVLKMIKQYMNEEA